MFKITCNSQDQTYRESDRETATGDVDEWNTANRQGQENKDENQKDGGNSSV